MKKVDIKQNQLRKRFDMLKSKQIDLGTEKYTVYWCN